MATKPTKITPPFSWLGRFATVITLTVITGAAALFRFWHLDTLPPGLNGQVASSALASLRLLEHGQLPGFTANVNYAPGWAVLQAGFIKLGGPTALSLRILPALLGTLAVITAWLWLRSWFGQRIAWMGALLLAVTPWVVTLSRTGSEAAIMPLLVTTSLWLVTRAWRHRRIADVVAAALWLVVVGFFGPIGWVITGSILALGAIQLLHPRRHQLLTTPAFVGFGVLAVAAVVLGILVLRTPAVTHDLARVTGLTSNPLTLAGNAVSTLLMFSISGSGDQNYQHNLSGQPILNVFLALMFVTGILVSISRVQYRRYRWLLALFAFLIAPAIATTVGIPNSARAIAVAPIVLAITAIGTSYLMEMWYATFPINSAARTVGQSAILVLLGLTVLLGYTQYFRAWGQSSEVYATSGEGTARLATNLRTSKFTGAVYFVAPADQYDIVAYLNHGGKPYQAISADQVISLPTTPGPRLFLMVPSARDTAVKAIKAKFPGGTLRPHYSPFNQVEIYYSYEITK